MVVFKNYYSTLSYVLGGNIRLKQVSLIFPDGRIQNSWAESTSTHSRHSRPILKPQRLKDPKLCRVDLQTYSGDNPQGVESGSGDNPQGVESGSGDNPQGVESGSGDNPQGVESLRSTQLTFANAHISKTLPQKLHWLYKLTASPFG